MNKNLFEFGDKKIEEDKTINQSNLQEEAKEIFDKYKDYSQNELLNEFLLTSKQNLKNGSLTKEKLHNTVEMLKPFLNAEQIDFVKGIIKKIDE